MKPIRFRVREAYRSSFIVERRKGLFWVCAIYGHSPIGGGCPQRFTTHAAAHDAMVEAIADWMHVLRVVEQVEVGQ